jgi:hypothetical protein
MPMQPADILQGILDLKWLIAIAIPLGLLILPIGLVMGDNLSWNQKRMKVFGILYSSSKLEALWLSAGLLRVLFVMSIAIFSVRMEASHTVFYVILVALCNVLFFTPKRCIIDLLNAAIIYGTLLVSNILMGYYRDVNGDTRIFSVYLLLSIFVVIYSVYHGLKTISGHLQYKILTFGGTDDD